MKSKKIFLSTKINIAIGCLFFISCAADKGGSNNDDEGTSLDFETSSTTTSNGRTSLSFVTAKDATKLLISAKSKKGNSIRFTKVNGGGANYLDPSNEDLSLGSSFTPAVNSVSIPSRSQDTALTSNTKIEADVQVEGSSIEGDEITFNVSSRADNNLNSGSLTLNIFYVGTIGSEETIKKSIDSAIATARNIFSNAGITTRINEKTITGPTKLPSPFNGSKLYEEASSSAIFPAVNIFVGGDIDESSDGTILGVAAGIPGPASPSLKSAVAISIFNSAGADGRFSDEDIRILGETFAHESGHFMGLFHPVDFNGSVVVDSDPLPDTESCTFITDCISRDNLIENLMFASPVADGNGSFVNQNRLTVDQRAVMNRYVAVN